MASEFEEELNSLDAKLEKAQKAAEGLVSGLKHVRRAAGSGIYPISARAWAGSMIGSRMPKPRRAIFQTRGASTYRPISLTAVFWRT